MEANKAIVRRYWEEVWNQGKLELIDELQAPDYDRDGQRLFISSIHKGFSASKVTIEREIAEGDVVVTHYTWRAVHTGVWDIELEGLSMAVPPTGKKIWDEGITIFRIAEGQIVETWTAWTKLELAQQLGVVPSSA